MKRILAGIGVAVACWAVSVPVRAESEKAPPAAAKKGAMAAEMVTLSVPMQ